jgi:hypothetical protein
MNIYYFQGEMTPSNSSSPEVIKKAPQEAIEFVPKFQHIKEDLQNLFNIEVTSNASLSYPWEKDVFYAKVVEDLNAGKPFALDYMFEEGLLTKEDLQERGIATTKAQAIEILKHIKGPIGRRMQDLMVNVGILTEEEALDLKYSA